MMLAAMFFKFVADVAFDVFILDPLHRSTNEVVRRKEIVGGPVQILAGHCT